MGLLQIELAPVATLKDLENRVKLWENLSKNPEFIKRFRRAYRRLNALEKKLTEQEEKERETEFNKRVSKTLKIVKKVV